MPEETIDTQETETSTVTTSPEETKEESTKESTEVKNGELTSSEKEELFDEIQTTEGDDERSKHGKFALTVGDSTYYGQTKKEVIQNLIKGKEEQDSFIRKVKASEKVTLPDEYKKGQEKEVEVALELPDDGEVFTQHLQSEVKKAGVDPKMLGWKDEQWIKYQDDNNLREFQISRLIKTVEGVIERAHQATDRDMEIATVTVGNNRLLEQSTKNVREMVAEAGIDMDKFDYKAVLDKAMEKKDKQGRIPAGVIETEAGKQLNRLRNQGTLVKKSIQSDIEKAKEAKDKIKTATNGSKVKETENGKPLSFDELAREEKNKLNAKSGRDI